MCLQDSKCRTGYTKLATDQPGVAAQCQATFSNGELTACDLLIVTKYEAVHLLGELNRVARITQLGEGLLVRLGERNASAAV